MPRDSKDVTQAMVDELLPPSDDEEEEEERGDKMTETEYAYKWARTLINSTDVFKEFSVELQKQVLSIVNAYEGEPEEENTK